MLLDGIRAVEAASMVLAPSAAMMRADFGAEVEGFLSRSAAVWAL